MNILYAAQYMYKQTNYYISIMKLLDLRCMDSNIVRLVHASSRLSCFAIPSSLALQKFPITKISGFFNIAWGIILRISS